LFQDIDLKVSKKAEAELPSGHAWIWPPIQVDLFQFTEVFTEGVEGGLYEDDGDRNA